MRQIADWSRALVALLSLCAAAPLFCQTMEIDRLVAAIDGKVITEGDLALARLLNALMLHGDPSKPAQRQQEIERLIDLELMRQEMESFPMQSGEDSVIEEKMEEIRHAYEDLGGLRALLRRWGLQEAELRDYLRLQVSMMRFIEFRFRPFVTVSTSEIQAYYQNRFVPESVKAGREATPLSQVASKIEEILVEEKINDAVEKWTADARRRARIEYFID